MSISNLAGMSGLAVDIVNECFERLKLASTEVRDGEIWDTEDAEVVKSPALSVGVDVPWDQALPVVKEAAEVWIRNVVRDDVRFLVRGLSYSVTVRSDFLDLTLSADVLRPKVGKQ